MKKTNWRRVPVPSHTIFEILDANFSKLDNSYEQSLPDFSNATTLLLGSDYSGESSPAPYLVYSFLLASLETWAQWEPKRLQIRQDYLSDSRRMSFKSLGDAQRQRALLPLLKAANSIRGLSFSVAINKKCDSLFAERIPLDLNNADFAAYRKWKPAVLEKAFLILHFLGFLLAGLAKSGQNVLWFTDEDNIAANEERIRELTNLFVWITTPYLTFNLGHCRCGTSRCDDGSKQIEDFLAIPDLVAGALAEQLKITTEDRPKLSGVFWMHRGDFSDKTKEITWWFSDVRHPLKRLVCIIDPTENGRSHIVSWFHFYDQAK